MPWIEALKREVERHGLGPVAEVMGVSRGAVSQLVNNKYPGNLDGMKKRVEGAFFNRTVLCPVAGEIPAQQCFTNQRKKPGSNPMNLRFFKACRSGCEHSQQKPQFSGELIESQYLEEPRATQIKREDIGRALELLRREAELKAGNDTEQQQLAYIDLLEKKVRELSDKLNHYQGN